MFVLGSLVNIKVSQRSVATNLKCGEIFNDRFDWQSFHRWRISKINQYLAKL